MAEKITIYTYNEVGAAYTRLFDYMEDKRLELTGPSRSLCLNGPDEVPGQVLLTEVQLPVR